MVKLNYKNQSVFFFVTRATAVVRFFANEAEDGLLTGSQVSGTRVGTRTFQGDTQEYLITSTGSDNTWERSAECDAHFDIEQSNLVNTQSLRFIK